MSILPLVAQTQYDVHSCLVSYLGYVSNRELGYKVVWAPHLEQQIPVPQRQRSPPPDCEFFIDGVQLLTPRSEVSSNNENENTVACDVLRPQPQHLSDVLAVSAKLLAALPAPVRPRSAKRLTVPLPDTRPVSAMVATATPAAAGAVSRAVVAIPRPQSASGSLCSLLATDGRYLRTRPNQQPP